MLDSLENDAEFLRDLQEVRGFTPSKNFLLKRKFSRPQTNSIRVKGHVGLPLTRRSPFPVANRKCTY